MLVAFGVGENCCSISSQKITKEIFENTDSDLKVHALHCANELLVHVRLSFQKLLQNRQTSRKNKKPSKTGFGYH